MIKKNAANIITSLRIIFSIVLLHAVPLGAMFYICYLICGLSDCVDGYVARKFNCSSEFGAKLDSVSDVLFLLCVAINVVPTLEIKPVFWIWAVIIFGMKIVCIIIIAVKYKTFGMLHSLSIKACGFILYALPLLLRPLGTDTVLWIAVVAGGISTFEELLLNITSKKLDLDQKSIFS